jgi:GNAT superfamily N-acetyltransferase
VSRTTSGLALTTRPYRDDDERSVLDLLRAALGEGPAGARSPRFFRWKHLHNPFGRSFMLVAEDDGRIVGLRAFLRWSFRIGGREVKAVRAVDTATHPDYQGRGVFSRLTLEALGKLRDQADLVFNTPNEKSLQGYLKMGWSIVGRVPVRVRVRRPLRFLRGLQTSRALDFQARSRPEHQSPRAEDVLGDGRVSELVSSSEVGKKKLVTPRTLEYLRWRYGSASQLDYRAVVLEEGDRLRGMSIFRVRPRGALWEATVAEVIVPAGVRGAERRLLRAVARSAPVDHLTCHFRSGASALSSGFLRAPGGITLVVNPLREGIQPDPTDLRSWAFSLGDLEVF